MTPNEYQALALRTDTELDFCGDVPMSRLMHGAMGMVTESAELVDMLKKHLAYGRKFDVTNVLEECGDALWYIAIALDACGLTMEQAMERNIAKLKARYGERFSEERALERDLEVERKVLEAK